MQEYVQKMIEENERFFSKEELKFASENIKIVAKFYRLFSVVDFNQKN